MKYKVIGSIKLKYRNKTLKMGDESDLSGLSEEEINNLLDKKYIEMVSIMDTKVHYTNSKSKKVELLSDDKLYAMKKADAVIKYGRSIDLNEELEGEKTIEELVQIVSDHIIEIKQKMDLEAGE